MHQATTVRVSKETRKLLAELGTKEESFDQIIRRLIDFYNKGTRRRGRE